MLLCQHSYHAPPMLITNVSTGATHRMASCARRTRTYLRKTWQASPYGSVARTLHILS